MLRKNIDTKERDDETPADTIGDLREQVRNWTPKEAFFVALVGGLLLMGLGTLLLDTIRQGVAHFQAGELVGGVLIEVACTTFVGVAMMIGTFLVIAWFFRHVSHDEAEEEPSPEPVEGETRQ